MTNATAKATIHTNYGDIVVELFGNHAPLTVENFIGLADGSRQWKHPRTGEIMNTPPVQGRRVPPHHQGLHDSGW